MVKWITEACGWAVRALTDVLTGGATEIIWTGLDIIKAIQVPVFLSHDACFSPLLLLTSSMLPPGS